jgi:ketosteroid isomerase-like protein
MSRFVALALVVGALVGCGANDDPESVVRAWAEAVNAGDNEAAASYFAPGARVVSGALSFPLSTHESAVEMHAALPCTSTLVETVVEGDAVVANFLLDERSFPGMCGGRGKTEGSIFTVREGKIVVWEILGRPGAVVADWADAVRRGENARAGHYFAPGAVVTQGARRRILETRDDAARFAAERPCAAEIVRSVPAGDTLTVTLRPVARWHASGEEGCEGSSSPETVVLTFATGRITTWRER